MSEGITISQVDLVSAILRELDRQHPGLKAPTRLLNSVIAAAKDIVAEAAEVRPKVADGMGLGAWLNSDETGLSSKFMAHVLAGGPFSHNNYPHDPSDFGRCLGLLRAVPELRDKLPQMRDRGQHWEVLVDNWAELEQLYYEEFPSGRAPKCYARMRELLKD